MEVEHQGGQVWSEGTNVEDVRQLFYLLIFPIWNSLNSLERYLQRVLVLYVHNSKNLETVQVYFDQAVYEQTVVYFHSQLLCSHQNE